MSSQARSAQPEKREKYYFILINERFALDAEEFLKRIKIDYHRIEGVKEGLVEFDVLVTPCQADIIETQMLIISGKYQVLDFIRKLKKS